MFDLPYHIDAFYSSANSMGRVALLTNGSELVLVFVCKIDKVQRIIGSGHT